MHDDERLGIRARLLGEILEWGLLEPLPMNQAIRFMKAVDEAYKIAVKGYEP